MQQRGGCQCGAVRFSTTGTPVRVMACHCNACKLRTGSVYGVGVYFEEQDVQIDRGDINCYRFESDTSGRWIENEFCATCGCAVFWTLEMRPGLRAVAGGTFDDPDWFTVDAHIWTRSARTDMCFPENMPLHTCALNEK